MSAPTNWEDGTTAGDAGRPPFVQIPEKLILDPTIHAFAVRAYCVLAHHVNRTSGTAWPSHAKIAEYMGISDRATVMKYLGELRDKGWIEWRRRSTQGGRSSNLYRLNMVPRLSGPAPTLEDENEVRKVGERPLSVVGERLHEPYRDEPDRLTTPPNPQRGPKSSSGSEYIEGQLDVLDLIEEKQTEPAPKTAAPAPKKKTRITELSDDDPRMIEFWQTYPRHMAKGAVRKSLAKALKLADFETIIAGARRFANDPNLPTDRVMIPYPATWLNQERWNDEALPVRYSQGARPSAASGWATILDRLDGAPNTHTGEIEA